VIVEHLRVRNWLAQYNYADLIKQLLFIAAIGGESLDESNTLKEQLSDHPELSRFAGYDRICFSGTSSKDKRGYYEVGQAPSN